MSDLLNKADPLQCHKIKKEVEIIFHQLKEISEVHKWFYVIDSV